MIIYFISLPGKMANKVPDPMVIIVAERMILGSQLSYFPKKTGEEPAAQIPK